MNYCYFHSQQLCSDDMTDGLVLSNLKYYPTEFLKKELTNIYYHLFFSLVITVLFVILNGGGLYKCRNSSSYCSAVQGCIPLMINTANRPINL